ncbi:MAG: cyclic nucleotide-binding domain-containing protein [Spirochaetes bacterium]|nr:MAG: cyclic nucleotide-binding domain-containing protein [Spirochaetota bacterium]
MNLRKAGWKLFSLRQDEYGFAIPLFMLYFFSGCFYSLGQIFTETLFLKTYGAQGLSRFFVYNGIALILSGTLYNLLLLKISMRRGYFLLIALATGIIALASRYAHTEYRWYVFSLYLANYLFTFFLDMHFFNFIYQYMTLRNSKRILPFLMGGGKLGGIAASALCFTIFARDISLYGFYMWAASGALLAIPVLLLRKRAAAAGAAPRAGGRELLPDLRIFERFARKIKLSYSSPIFTWSLLVVFVMSIVNQVSEYYFAHIFNAVFETKQELARFLAVYTFSADLVTLLLQLFLVSRLIKRAGVQASNYFYPGSFLAFITLAIVSPGILAGVALRFFRKNLGLLFRVPVFNIIMAASPRDRITEVKSFLTGIVSPLGMVAGGGILLLIYKKLPAEQGYALAIVTGCAFVALTFFQNRAYRKTLKKRLSLDLAAGARNPEYASYESLARHGVADGRSVRIMEAFFHAAPSLDLLNHLAPHFPSLSRRSKELMFGLLEGSRYEGADALAAAALADPDPLVRSLGLGHARGLAFTQREKLLAGYAPESAAERFARALLLSRPGDDGTGTRDADSRALAALTEIGGGVLSGALPPEEFVLLAQALPPVYATTGLLGLAKATGDGLFLTQLAVRAELLDRAQARRILYRYRHAPFGELAAFITRADSLTEIDRAILLDYRAAIPFEHMTAIFRFDEKTRDLILKRLLETRSFPQKSNYLNYLTSLEVKPVRAMEAFLDYEIDKTLYLHRLRDAFLAAVPQAYRDSIPVRFTADVFDSFRDLHKHLVLKCLAVLTGVDMEEVYDSNLLLKDRDLNNYILEYIESSGKVARRALALLEREETAPAPGESLSCADASEIAAALASLSGYFAPHLARPLRACAGAIRAYICDGPAGPGGEEQEMLSLVEKMVFLKENTLFRELQMDELFHIAQITGEMDLPRDKDLIREGTMGDELYILAEGEVEVYTRGKSLAKLGPGSCIGELSIIDTEPRSASARTTKKSRLLFIQRRDFLLTLRDNPAISINIMQVIAQRLRKMIAS